jgi:hypothetical protein
LPDLRLNLCALDRKTGCPPNNVTTQLRHRCAHPNFATFRQQSLVKNAKLVSTGVIFSGPVFSLLRAQSLAFYPNDVCVRYRQGVSFDDWTASGSYVLAASDKKRLVLRSSPTEFASVFLSDIENLINHSFEQFVEIQRLSVDPVERSDAWGVVTIYYYAFFSAQALLRLLGHPVLYLDSNALLPLKGLAGANSIPGAGSFLVSLVNAIGPTDGEFELKKLNARSHNAVWAELFRILRHELAAAKQAGNVSAEEEIFYGGLCSNVAHRLYSNLSLPIQAFQSTDLKININAMDNTSA